MKLEIPAPDEPQKRDETQLSDGLWFGVVLSALVIFFGWFFWIQPQTIAEEDPFADIDDEQQRQVLRDRANFQEMVERGNLERFDWLQETEEMVRVFEVGPREAAEVACRDFEEVLGDAMGSRQMRRVLRQGVSRRSENIPWTCLTRLYLEDRLPEDGELTEEINAFWEDVESLREGPLVATIIEDFSDSDQGPQSGRFERWLSRCALAVDYEADMACQRLFRERNPQEPKDVLGLAVDVLAEVSDTSEPDSSSTDDDLVLVVDSLTSFAQDGQPRGWYIAETDHLADYEVDFKLGSLFMLCRMMNSPDETVQSRAAAALGEVAEVGGRPSNPRMHYRWRKTCRLAFGDPEVPDARVPLLGVSMIDGEQETVDYGMDALVEAQICTEEPGLPIWYCGAEQWTGGGDSIRRVMGDYFALSSYVEWYELDELAEVMPQE